MALRVCGCGLRSVPKSSVLLEFIRSPRQAKDVAYATAHHDAPGAIFLSEEEGASCHRQGPHQRIDEENFPFVCPQIISFGKNDHIGNHVQHEHTDGTWVEQALSEPEMLNIQVNTSKPCR